MSLQRTLYLPNSVTKIPVPAEIENFLGVLTGKPAFLLGHIARSLLLGQIDIDDTQVCPYDG
jgi:hypothetical protein